MLEDLIRDDEMSVPCTGFALYTITKRQDREPQNCDPEAGAVMRLGDVFDLRNPCGDVIATDHDLRYLRGVQSKHNTVAVLG